MFEGAEPQPRGHGAFALVGALVIGLLTGFAGGFVLGQRGTIPEPRQTAAVPAPATETFTEAAIAEPAAPKPAEPAPVEAPTPPAPPVRATGVVDEPATLTFASRPAGAQVFLDGRLVGRTPLVVPDVKIGSRRVRLELAGHRTWATVVNVNPGSRQRVGASLEE